MNKLRYTNPSDDPADDRWFSCEPVEHAGSGGRLCQMICLYCGRQLGVAGSYWGKRARKLAHEACCRRVKEQKYGTE